MKCIDCIYHKEFPIKGNYWCEATKRHKRISDADAHTDAPCKVGKRAEQTEPSLVNDSPSLVKDLVEDELYDEECLKCKHLKPRCEFIPTYCNFEPKQTESQMGDAKPIPLSSRITKTEPNLSDIPTTTEDCSIVDPLHDDCFDCDKFFTCDNKGEDYKTDCPWK